MKSKDREISGTSHHSFSIGIGLGERKKLHLFLRNFFGKKCSSCALVELSIFSFCCFSKTKFSTTSSFFRDITSRRSLLGFFFWSIPFFFLSFFGFFSSVIKISNRSYVDPSRKTHSLFLLFRMSCF